ncbi:MAG: hypothetical protein ACR2OG_17435 [Gemmatimonadaceae bacterium]
MRLHLIHRALITAPLVVILAVTSRLADAQAVTPSRPGMGSAATCTYDQCSLRLEESSVLQGIEGRQVARLSTFSNVVSSVPWLNDSARAYARSARSSHVGATLMKTLGFGSSVAGIALGVKAVKDARDRANATPDATAVIDEKDVYTALGFQVGGWVLNRIGEAIDSHARKTLARAVWWHNRDLSR